MREVEWVIPVKKIFVFWAILHGPQVLGTYTLTTTIAMHSIIFPITVYLKHFTEMLNSGKKSFLSKESDSSKSWWNEHVRKFKVFFNFSTFIHHNNEVRIM